MKVKTLIEELKKMNPEATVCISTLASENCLRIKDIKSSKSWVEFRADDIDFKLDDDGLAIIEEMQDEEARDNAINSQIDSYLGK
jgi:hypothetical protein